MLEVVFFLGFSVSLCFSLSCLSSCLPISVSFPHISPSHSLSTQFINRPFISISSLSRATPDKQTPSRARSSNANQAVNMRLISVLAGIHHYCPS